MKRYLLIGTAATLLCCTSCEDFFDMQPKGSVDATVFYSDINNLRIGLNSIYNLAQGRDYQLSEMIFGEALSDNSWNGQDMDGKEMCQLLNFQFNTENPYLLTRYDVNYKGINMANQVIRSVPVLKFREEYDINYKEIREVLGQAKLFRALFYFNLVRTFGGVSIQPEDQDLKKLVVPRSSIDDVYAYIEKDLREAILLLRRDNYKLGEAGQAGVGAAFGLLMKVLAYQASPGIKLVSPNRDAKWSEAREIARLFLEGQDMTFDQIMKYNERYSESWESVKKRLGLSKSWTPQTVFPGQDIVNVHGLDNFDRIFRAEGEFSKESLFEINHHDYSSAGVTYDEGWQLYYCVTKSTDTELNITPSKDLSDQFVNDPRKIFTLTDRNLSEYFLDGKSAQDVDMGWYSIGNMLCFTKYYVFPWEGSVKIRNYRIMKYTEAVLWYAEILNETGDQEKATTWLNKIRVRARKLLDPSNENSKYNSGIQVANFKDYPVLPYDLVKANIQKERRIELAGEFDRWYDIVRLGIVGERMKYIANNPPSADPKGTRWRGLYFKRGVNEIFPIPQREVLISNGVIEQNFGY